MKSFLRENKIFLAIVIGTAIIDGAVYFSVRKENSSKPAQEVESAKSSSQSCQNIPELADSSRKLATRREKVSGTFYYVY